MIYILSDHPGCCIQVGDAGVWTNEAVVVAVKRETCRDLRSILNVKVRGLPDGLNGRVAGETGKRNERRVLGFWLEQLGG